MTRDLRFITDKVYCYSIVHKQFLFAFQTALEFKESVLDMVVQNLLLIKLKRSFRIRLLQLVLFPVPLQCLGIN